jgi:hypothetical protein
MRLQFLTEAAAQSKADSIHARMIAADATYAQAVTAGQITAWAIPYQDLNLLGIPISLFWYVNAKARVTPVLTALEIADLVAYAL